MSQHLDIVYISLTGNTKSFVKRLVAYLNSQYTVDITTINIKELTNHETFPVQGPIVAFLPTYLEGGNGVNTGDVEILTNPLGDFLASHDNYSRCFGIVGSGNRNFNHQFCLTARQYSQRFGFPVLDEFELRGLQDDVIRIGDNIMAKLEKL
ncbi:class Ib ribonucleoside-diphosphate reductase assembly flavoprotein NrdI [Streptococcus caprae]|uniref:Putative NrdI-like protein n=1 Tax=Streptococcus caprae TaxID=1640501 RepID=A0ABV8CU00_9STRE